jgi:hypothetical protein
MVTVDVLSLDDPEVEAMRRLDQSEGRRIRRVRVCDEVVVAMLMRDDRKIDRLCWIEGLPLDATLVNACFDPSAREVEFYFESASFDPVQEGKQIPDLLLSAGWERRKS